MLKLHNTYSARRNCAISLSAASDCGTPVTTKSDHAMLNHTAHPRSVSMQPVPWTWKEMRTGNNPDAWLTPKGIHSHFSLSTKVKKTPNLRSIKSFEKEVYIYNITSYVKASLWMERWVASLAMEPVRRVVRASSARFHWRHLIHLCLRGGGACWIKINRPA